MKDPYLTLKVLRSDSIKEIKKKYRKLVRKYHPDVSDDPQAHKKISIINKAMEEIEKTHSEIPSKPIEKSYTYSPAQQEAKKYDSNAYKNYKVVRNIPISISDIDKGEKDLSYIEIRRAGLDSKKKYKVLIDYNRILIEMKAAILDVSRNEVLRNKELLVETIIIDDKYKQMHFHFDDVLNVQTKVYVPKKILKLGGKIKLKTIDSNVTITLKPDTKHLSRLRIKNKGIRKVLYDQGTSERTDFYVTLHEKGLFTWNK